MKETIYTCYACPDGRCFSKTKYCEMKMIGRWEEATEFYEPVDDSRTAQDLAKHLNRLRENGPVYTDVYRLGKNPVTCLHFQDKMEEQQ